MKFQSLRFFVCLLEVEIMLGLRAASLFLSRRQRTTSSKSTPTPLFLLGSNPPCIRVMAYLPESLFRGSRQGL